jgi:hypothetical protein
MGLPESIFNELTGPFFRSNLCLTYELPILSRTKTIYCRCLNLSTSMGGTRSKVEGGDRHDLEPEGTREDTRHEIYTSSGSRSSYPTSCLE